MRSAKAEAVLGTTATAVLPVLARRTRVLLLMALRRTAVRDQVEVHEEEARQLYLAQPDLFMDSDQIWIEEILVDDVDEARVLRQRLESGEQFDDLAHLSKRAGTEDGHLHLHAHRRAKYGDLVDAALAAELGQLVGPVKVPQGYSVFRVLEKSSGELMPFAEVKKQATAILRLRREEQRFNNLVSDLRQKYADQVRIFEPDLNAVKLPVDDAYVRRQEAIRDMQKARHLGFQSRSRCRFLRSGVLRDRQSSGQVGQEPHHNL